MSLYTEHVGNSANPDLVILHGWGMNSTVWHSAVSKLQEHFYLTLIDLPGLGRSSDRPEPYNSQTVVDALLSAAPDRAAWLGWSLGGQLAIKAAAQAPERVTRLVTVGSNPCFVARDDWSTAMSSDVYQGFVDALAENPAKTLTRFVMLQTQGAEAGRDTLKQLKKLLKENAEPTALEESLGLLEEDVRPQLAALSQPVLMQFGERDLLVPVDASHACGQLNSAITVKIYAGAGHLPFISHSDEWATDLIHFLTSTAV